MDGAYVPYWFAFAHFSAVRYLTSLGLGRGSGAERRSSMSFPEPCGELSQTVNETVARTGQEPAGGWASPGSGPALPGQR